MSEDRLRYERKLVWDSLAKKEERKEVFDFADGYRQFLSAVKTERETVNWTKKTAETKGFRPLFPSSPLVGEGRGEGGKLYLPNRSYGFGLVVLGKKPLSEGFRLIVSHIDSPHLDLKPQPLIEEEALGFLKTHYYGGIKKYHWVANPLSLHGVIILKDGTKKEILVGEKESEPVLTITDLLPHLAKEQMEKKMSEAIQGESLNLLIGSLPVPKKKEDDNKKEATRVKGALLKLLYATYGITEEDLVSAEVQAVPAGTAKDLGLDRSLILGYGQDDRICVYTSLQALFQIKQPEYTAVCLLVDREEIGSEGVASAKSTFLRYFLGRSSGLGEAQMNESFAKSYAISGDVNAGLDPAYKDVSESQNAPRLGYGTVLTKFTGHGGKFSSSEVSAEYVAYLRRLFEKHKVFWQTGELGRIDKGGGGTVAKYLAQQNLETIDIGPALLSMHAPYEVSHKADLYSTYRAYLAFYRS